MTKMSDPWAEIKALRMHVPPEQTMQPIQPNRLGMNLSRLLRKGKELGNAPGTLPESVPLIGGMGAGDLFFGETPEITEDWAHGFPPWSGQGYGAQVDPGAIDYVGLPLAGTGAALGSRALGRGLRREMVGEAAESTPPKSELRRIIDELRQQKDDSVRLRNEHYDAHPDAVEREGVAEHIGRERPNHFYDDVNRPTDNDFLADPSRREFLKNAGAATAVGLVAANTPDFLRKGFIKAVPKIGMPKEAPANAIKQLLYGASPKLSHKQTQIIDSAVDKMDPRLMKDVAEYFEKLDWEKAVPGAERRFAMSTQDLRRKDLGLPERDVTNKPGDFWETDAEGWTTKNSKSREADKVLHSLTPEELGNWVISGNPPKGKFTNEQLIFLGVDDVVSQIDRVTPITYTKGTLFWRNLPDEAKKVFYD